MATTNVKSNVCVKCGGPSTRGKPLSLVGSTKGKREGHQEGEHPLDKLLQQSRTLQLETLTKTLENNARENAPTYIHSYCRTFLNNKCRPKRASKTQEAISAKRVVPQNVSSTTRPTAVGFNFKSQCFIALKSVYTGLRFSAEAAAIPNWVLVTFSRLGRDAAGGGGGGSGGAVSPPGGGG